MEFVGKSFKKEFKGRHDAFSGIVESYDSSSGFFSVVYEDGVCEELGLKEVALLMGDRDGAEGSVTEPEPRRIESREQMDSGDENIVDLNDGCTDNLRESMGFNGTLDKGVDLNNGFVEVEKLDNCDADLRNVELDLNEGFNFKLNDGIVDINVCYEERKKGREAIDLNLDVNSEAMEGDLEMVESQRREHCFDLNLGVDDDHETSDDDNNSEHRKRFNERTNEASVVSETRNMENSVGVVEGTLVKGEFANLTLVEVNVDEDYRTAFVGGSLRGSIISCQDFMGAVVEPSSAVTVGSSCKAGRGRRRKNVSDSMGVTIRTTEGRVHDSNGIQLKEEGLLESGSALIDGSQGDAEGPQRLGRGRRKSRRLFGDLSTEEGVFGHGSTVIDESVDNVGSAYKQGRSRKKSRKLSEAMEAMAVIVSGDTNPVFSEENKLHVSNDIQSKVESKTPRGRKRKNVEENVNAVLRRSSRRGSLRHNDSSTTLYDKSLTPSVSEEMEEKPIALDVEGDEEPIILPPQLQLPPCSRDLDLEGLPVLDVFSIYACLRSFSTLLFLSPFQLEDFVAALKSKSPSILIDCVHVSILQTLRKHLEILANEGSETASNCIRSLNWDLIDLITWPVFIAEYLMIHGAESRPGFDLNLLKMFKSDYYNQPVSVKVEILRCLCDDLIEVDAVRLELNRRSSATEHELDFDRNITIDGHSRRKRSTLDVTNGSCLTEEIADDSNDWNIDECCLCKMDGSLICCDGCPAAYHSKCVGIAHDLLPQGDWYCPECATNRLVPWLKPRKSLRGAEILGIDPHSRVYFNSCGYLLVSDSCDVDGSFTFYHRDDLNAVIDVLKSSEYFYSGIIKGIYRHWELPTGTGLNGTSRNFGYLNTPTTTILVKELSPDVGMPDQSEYQRAHIATAMEGLSTNSEAAAAKEDPDSHNTEKLLRDCTNTASELSNPSEGPEISQRLASSDIKHESGGRDLAKESTLQSPCEISYFNHYSFAQAAASVVEELTSKSAHKGNDVVIKLKSEEEIISIQMKAILKHCQKFWWPNLQSLSADALKEKCGWCYLCRGSDDDLDCLFKMNTSLIKEGSKSDVVDLLSKRNKKGHLVDVICHVLSIEHRLCGLLLGPWLNPHYSKIWCKSILKAPDLMTLKQFLIMLETNLHPRAFSAEWLKHVDSSLTLGSACHVVIATSRASLKKRARGSEIENKPSSNAAGGLSLCWWRGGGLSRQVFNWKVLPHSLASKAARQAGRSKIPGILYPESSDFAKRSKNLTWRAAVESATSPEQLAFQVRELDSNLKWHDFENTHPPSTLDKEALKSIRLFRKAVVRRKSTEGDVNYLIDFGNKRRSIPDVVAKHGVIVEESSNERKKYWLNECYMPLYLLKSFEEKRIVRKLNNISSGKKLGEDSIVVKKTSKERGFSYLFARAEKSIYHLCGHCSKDVLISEAACCQYCEGFFHKRHVRKSAGSIVAECIYTCHKCHSGKSEKKKKKNGKTLKGRGNADTKVKLEKGKKVSTALTARRSARLIKGKKLGRGRGRPPKSKTVNKAVIGVPLRRSPRKVKYVPLDKKNIAKRKKGKRKTKVPVKTKTNTSLQKKRTQAYHSYWLNGLHLSRKPDDERVMQFKAKRFFTGPEQSAKPDDGADLPKCSLCHEAGYTSASSYIACEICGEWFHGDAYGLNLGNMSRLVGFRCHVCRKKTPPVCPLTLTSIEDGSQLIEKQ